MLAARRGTFWWVLVASFAAVFAVLLVVAVTQWRDERSGEQAGSLPVDFRTAAGTSTDELIGTLQRRLRENPEDLGSRVDLANAYLQKVRETGDPTLYAKADDLLDGAGKPNATSPEVFAARGALDLARHRFADAMEQGKRALVLDPESARYHGIVGDAQIELGMYDRAIESYQEMVDLRPDFDSFSRVSHARELYGDPEGAIEAMEFALQSGSGATENMAWAHAQLGNLWFGLGDLEEAEKAYARSTETLDDYAPALAGRAKVAAAEGELDRAADLYRRAFDRMPLAEYAIALGDVHAEMGDKQMAAGQYDLVRQIDELNRTNGVNTDLEIALFYADHGVQTRASLEKARSAYEARPSIHAADVLAWTLYKDGRYEEAQKYSSEALRLGTRDPLMLFHAGMISRELGKNEQAREHLQKALDLNPHFSVLHADTAARALDDLENVKPGGGQ